MPLLIPVIPSEASYRFSMNIENVTYVFEFNWNVRDLAWFMNILELDETPIARGLKIVLGTYIGRRTSARPFSAGVFVAADTTKQGREATFDDFGTRVELRYIPEFELAAMLHQATADGFLTP